MKSIAQVAEAKTTSNKDTTKKGNTTAKAVNSMKTNSKVTNNSGNVSVRADAQPGNTSAGNGTETTADQASAYKKEKEGDTNTMTEPTVIAAKTAEVNNLGNVSARADAQPGSTSVGNSNTASARANEKPITIINGVRIPDYVNKRDYDAIKLLSRCGTKEVFGLSCPTEYTDLMTGVLELSNPLEDLMTNLNSRIDDVLLYQSHGTGCEVHPAARKKLSASKEYVQSLHPKIIDALSKMELPEGNEETVRNRILFACEEYSRGNRLTEEFTHSELMVAAYIQFLSNLLEAWYWSGKLVKEGVLCRKNMEDSIAAALRASGILLG